MHVSSEIIIAVVVLIVALFSTLAIMVRNQGKSSQHVTDLVADVKGLTADARESNQLTIKNATAFTQLIAETRREFDAHQAQRAEIERELHAARDLVDAHEDRIQELEQGCMDYDAKIESQVQEITRLKVSEAELRAQLADRDARILRLEAVILSRDEALASLTARVSTLEGENNRLAREEKHWEKERADWKAERETWQQERTALISERESLQVQIGEMRAEIDALKRHGTGPLPDLPEAAPAQPEAGEEPSEAQDNGEEKPDGA
ncbi:MAG: hypothetical protein WC657_06885 [Candidatus Paceibacterota bacterium]|jgi:chromosome segregation ATPase